MVGRTFPVLLELMNNLLTLDNEEAANVLHWILKVYWQEPQTVTSWME